MALFDITLLLLTVAAIVKPVRAAQRILVYTRTVGGYRHDSIPNAIATLHTLAERNSSEPIEVVSTASKKKMNDPDFVNSFDALVFVSVSGDVLSARGAGNVRRYIEAGGGMLGVHSASDALTAYPWYGRLIGAFFNHHPEQVSQYLVLLLLAFLLPPLRPSVSAEHSATSPSKFSTAATHQPRTSTARHGPLTMKSTTLILILASWAIRSR